MVKWKGYTAEKNIWKGLENLKNVMKKVERSSGEESYQEDIWQNCCMDRTTRSLKKNI